MTEANLALFVPAGTHTVLDAEAAQAKAGLAQVQAITISDALSEQKVADLRGHLKARVAALESQRKDMTGGLDKVKRQIDALFRPVRTAYEVMIEACDAKLSAAETARRDAARAAEAQARALAAKGQLDAAQAALPAPEARPAGPTYVEQWEATVTDLVSLCRAVAEGRAPADWVRADDSAIKVALRTYKDVDTIPFTVDGVVFKKVAKPRGY